LYTVYFFFVVLVPASLVIMTKRSRENTPKKSGKMADVMSAISADTSAFEKAIDADFKGMEGAASFKKMGEQLAKMWKGTVMGFVQKQATHISDLCQAVADLEEKLEEVTVRETEAGGNGEVQGNQRGQSIQAGDGKEDGGCRHPSEDPGHELRQGDRRPQGDA